MKATKEQIIAEANRRRAEHGEGAPPVEHFIVDVVCENWTPTEPVVDPDILAYQEWASERWPSDARNIRMGNTDHDGAATYFLAGARMAREQERERAKVLVEYVEADARRPDYRRGRPQIDVVGARARETLAKYFGGA